MFGTKDLWALLLTEDINSSIASREVESSSVSTVTSSELSLKVTFLVVEDFKSSRCLACLSLTEHKLPGM